MKKFQHSLFLLAALCLLAALAFGQSANADLSGDWSLSFDSPQGSYTFKTEFKQSGDQYTSLIPKTPFGEIKITAVTSGQEVKMASTINFQGSELPVTLVGKVEGDVMKGKADYGGLAAGEWSAKRTGAHAAAPDRTARDEKVDVTGTWDGEVTFSGGSGNPSFTFKQEGEKLSGQYKGQLGEAPITGTVKGNQINFSFKVSSQIEATITYTGTVEKDTMKGKVQLGEYGEGTWSAKRK